MARSDDEEGFGGLAEATVSLVDGQFITWPMSLILRVFVSLL